jgi:uncharacterized membrane protein
MTVLILGLVIFLGVHLTRVVGIRNVAVSVIGEALFAVFYSILSVIGFVLIIYGHILAHPSEIVWYPPDWSRTVALIAVPISLVLIVATYVPCHIRAFFRHPMTFGVFLWSGSHLLANGELASVVLFGSFFVWSALLLLDGFLRGGSFAHSGKWTTDFIVIVIGLGAAGAFAYFHMHLFGVAIVEFASEPLPPGI